MCTVRHYEAHTPQVTRLCDCNAPKEITRFTRESRRLSRGRSRFRAITPTYCIQSGIEPAQVVGGLRTCSGVAIMTSASAGMFSGA